MEQKKFLENRRTFLAKAVPLSALACLGCKGPAVQQLMAGSTRQEQKSLGMSTEETYSFFYGMFIPLLRSLENEIGSGKFIDLITKVSLDSLRSMVTSMTKDLPKKDLQAFASFLKDILAAPPYSSAFSCEIVEQTDSVLELKYTDCIPARLLRSMKAADIGLAIECSGAKAAVDVFNAKINYTNPKNIMKGDNYCLERFTFRA